MNFNEINGKSYFCCIHYKLPFVLSSLGVVYLAVFIIVPNIKRILQIQQNLLSMQIVNFIANAISKYNEHFNLLQEVNQHQILTQEF